MAGLAGLEAALEHGDQGQLSDAIARVNLLHTTILGFGSASTALHGRRDQASSTTTAILDDEHAADNRWVHRPRMDWDAVAAADADPSTPGGRILAGLRHTIGVRKRLPQLHASIESRVLPSPDSRVLLLTRNRTPRAC